MPSEAKESASSTLRSRGNVKKRVTTTKHKAKCGKRKAHKRLAAKKKCRKKATRGAGKRSASTMRSVGR